MCGQHLPNTYIPRKHIVVIVFSLFVALQTGRPSQVSTSLKNYIPCIGLAFSLATALVQWGPHTTPRPSTGTLQKFRGKTGMDPTPESSMNCENSKERSYISPYGYDWLSYMGAYYEFIRCVLSSEMQSLWACFVGWLGRKSSHRWQNILHRP